MHRGNLDECHRPIATGTRPDTRHEVLRNTFFRRQREGVTDLRTDGHTLFWRCFIAPKSIKDRNSAVQLLNFTGHSNASRYHSFAYGQNISEFVTQLYLVHHSIQSEVLVPNQLSTKEYSISTFAKKKSTSHYL